MQKNIQLIIIGLLLFFFTCQAQTASALNFKKKTYAIDSLFTPTIGGIKQVIRITTDDSNRPILLFLSGGPGSSMMNNSEKFTNILKDKFTLVQWDQRDAGKTLKLNPSPIPPSLKQMGNDTFDVIKIVLKELNQKKIYL